MERWPQVYRGINLRATKRLSNQWMLRGYVTYGQAEWDIPDSFYFYKGPTDLAGATQTLSQGRQDNNGDVYFDLGRRGSRMQSSWAFNLNGMYQIATDRPWGFNIAGNLYGREGLPLPYFVNFASPSDGLNRFADAVHTADEFRAHDLFTADLRLEQEFAATCGASLTFAIDAFSIFNENTVLRREISLSGARPDYVNETLSARIFRLGVRINWRSSFSG